MGMYCLPKPTNQFFTHSLGISVAIVALYCFWRVWPLGTRAKDGAGCGVDDDEQLEAHDDEVARLAMA